MRNRLVAHQEGELAPGMHHRVRDHLRDCRACAREERRLATAVPGGRLWVPEHVQAALEARVNVGRLRAIVSQQPAPGRWTRLVTWLDDEVVLRRPVALAWAAALLMAVGWGAHSWHRAQTSLAPARMAVSVADPVGNLPPGAYQPAAWSPPPRVGGDDPHR